MTIDIPSFRGMAPRLTSRALPPNAAQHAVNARLLSGDLSAWRQFTTVETRGHDPATIYLLNDVWLSWEGDVDVARGLIPGDTSYRVYLTGDQYDQPRWTNYAYATGSPGGPAPVVTFPLGVPNPDSIPIVTVVPAVVSDTPEIDVTDSGGDLDSWVTSAPVSAGVGGGFQAVYEVNSSASPSLYRLNTDAGTGGNYRFAYMHKDFGIGTSSAITYEADFRMTNAEDMIARQFCAHIANPVDGNGIVVFYDNLSAEGKLQIGSNAIGWEQTGGPGTAFSPLASVAVGTLTGPQNGSDGYQAAVNTGWYHLMVEVTALNDDEQTVTATLYDGYGNTTTVLGTVSVTSRFSLGAHCGQVFGHAGDSRVASTWVDCTNIHVTGEGERGLIVLDVPTNYLFTYVNSLGEESGVFLPSDTVLRPDGASILVVTTTQVPAYTSVDYDIVSKRIYRSVVGNAAEAFLFVAEIPLSQAEYIDSIPDAQLGDPIESLLWVLPPDNLRGIIALPNGIMAGFFANQLCFSARNNPHAWPVEYRRTVDSAIVGIKNLDTTVVVGTETFPYLAEGVDPAAYSLRKLDDVPQACVSKRGMAVLSSGVLMPSPDGYIAVSQSGKATNLTESIFTRHQWQALDPPTIMAVVHDDVLHFWYGEMIASSTTLFLDTFTGAGALIGHTPDVAPAGFAWLDIEGFGTVGLTGSGYAGYLTGGSGSFNAESDRDWTPLPTASGFTFSLTARVTFLDNAGGQVNAQLGAPSDAESLTLQVTHTGTGNTAVVQLDLDGDTLSFTSNNPVPDLALNTDFTLSVAATANGWTLSYNGNVVATGSENLTTFGTVDYITLGGTRDFDGGPSEFEISEMLLTTP